MTTLGLPHLWLGSPQWQHASWAVRGLQAHLWMLAASRTPAGTLPDDDKWLRKALELPTPASASRARKAVMEAAAALPAPGSRKKKAAPVPVVGDDVQSAPLDWSTAHARVLDALLTGQVDEELQDAQQDAWLDHLWVNHWKEQLFEGWLRIDDALIDSQPQLSRARGGWFHPLAEALSRGAAETADAPRRTPKAPRARVEKGSPLMEYPFAGGGRLTPAAEEHLNPWWGTMDESRLLQVWAVPLSKEDSSEMWKTGVSYLATHGKSEELARRFMSRLVKAHGEKAVHQAIQALARRITPPVDSFSFVQGLLNQQGEMNGTPAEQKARSQRAKVAL